MPRAAWFGSYKDDRNLSFLVEHGGRRILVHPSAGLRNMRALEANIVFLRVGRLGRMGEVPAGNYLQALVGDATTVLVPIHWDRFTTRLRRPHRPTPSLLDDVEAGFGRVCGMAASRPALAVMKMDALAQLTFGPAGRLEFVGPAAPLCGASHTPQVTMPRQT